MRILFSGNLLLLGISILAAWLLVRLLLIPHARAVIRAANVGRLVSAGGRFGFLLTLQVLLDAMLLATVVVATVGTLLKWYISTFADAPSAIARVVWVRDRVEQSLDRLGWLSAESWVVCLAVLALVWLAASRSASRRAWEAALATRRAALSAAVVDLGDEELVQRANILDPKGIADLDSKTQAVLAENTARIRALQEKAIVQFGQDTQKVASLNSLRAIEEMMRKEAVEKADADDEERRSLTQSADGLHERIEEIEAKVVLPLRTLDDTCEVSLTQALADVSVAVRMKEKRQVALQHLIVEAQLANHSIAGLSKSRREPELISEWLSAGATSVATVQTTSTVGRASAFLCLLTFFLGFVGLGVLEVGPSIVSEAAALELTLIAKGAQPDLTAAINETGTKTSPPPPQAELASENATIDFLRRSFRASVARTLQDSVRLTARDRFDLASVEARQRILVASARSAAPSAEGGRERQVFNFTQSIHRPDVVNSTTVLDEALDRRITMLRQNEGLWTSLRMAAARPAPADLVAESFLKTAFPTGDLPDALGVRLWAERASLDFALHTARSGRPPDKSYRVPSFTDGQFPLSLRDQRLVADYRSDAPQQVERALLGIREGVRDPGSLHRGLPGVLATQSAPSPYSEYFPPAAGDDFPRAGGGPAGGGGFFGPGEGGRPPRAGPSSAMRVATATSARSFAKIRFSGRIGGVLIGSPPERGGEKTDVRHFEWELANNALYLTLIAGTERSVKLGPYHPAIAYHALAYAADGRVVTSTLPQPQSSDSDEIRVNARRVLVHPAFEDTAFACSAIQVDRFVDTFTKLEQVDPVLQHINAVREGVTDLGVLLEILREDRFGPESDQVQRFIDPVAKYTQTCGAGTACFPVEAYEKYGFRFGAASDFLGCLSRKEDAAACFKIMRSKPISATYLVDSGVREAPFVLDNKLIFLTGEDRASDPLWPLDFMIQAVPQTPRGDVTVDATWEPWRFPTIDGEIKEEVAKGVASDPNARAVLSNMRDFTILQRLFRLAFSGELGFEFPLEELVKLQQAAAPFVRVERSERWNLNGPLLRTLGEQHNRLVASLQGIAAADALPDACRAAAREAVHTEDSKHWPETEGVWSAVRSVEHACVGVQVASDFLKRVRMLRELDLVDEAIQFARSDRTSKPAQFHCSAL
jgi:hypothetical protein